MAMTVHQLYKRAMDAEKAFERQLKRSGEERYSMKKSPRTKQARDRMIRAVEKWREASRKQANAPSAKQLSKGIKCKEVQIKKVNGRFQVRIKK